MSTIKIDCSVLDEVILELYTYHRVDRGLSSLDRVVGHILTALVENNYVDETWGLLMYSKDGNYLPDGMETDRQILRQLDDYVTKMVSSLE